MSTLEEKLIELVKEREYLYNKQSKEYNRKDLKEKGWNEISQKLEIPVSKCKIKWKNFRDKFKKLNQKVIGQPGEAAEPLKWKYFNRLNFLNICYDGRESKYDPTQSAPVIVKVEYVDSISDENSSNLPPTTSAPSISSAPIKHQKKKDAACHNEFKSFLEKASLAIASSQFEMESKTSTTMLFESLAAKINEANLPREVLNALEKSVADTVYNVIN